MDNSSHRYMKPDRDLINWEKWITIREEDTANIAQKINRAPVDMVMNLHERVRHEKEWKSAMQNAQIVNKPTIRGTIWDQPERLKQKHCYDPVYEVHRKREEIGDPRTIEHIGVPKYVLENEKCVYGVPERKKCTQIDKEFTKYKAKREGELLERIKKIDPFRSEIDDLIVEGHKPNPITKPLPALPDIKVTSPNDYHKNQEALKTQAVFAVRINNSIFIEDSKNQALHHLLEMQQAKWHEACSSWSYYFNVAVKRVGRAKLFLQNLGTVSLRYCWKKVNPNISFIPDEGLNQVFFFNKNEDVLSPGQTKEVCFTFASDKTGFFSEFWELGFVNVSFFKNVTKKLTVKLQADTVEDIENIYQKINILKVKVNRKAVRKLIRTMLNDIVDEATCVELQPYPYKHLLLESEVFVMKNPICYYHQTEVMKLKTVYNEMMPNETWDLCIESWREVMVKKTFDDRMRYYNILKESHDILLKPWSEVYDNLKEKHAAVKLILFQLANKFDKVYSDLSHAFNVLDQSLEVSDRSVQAKSSVLINSDKQTLIRIIFYFRMYDNVKLAVETCAGVMSSIDANRWIKFDFCQVNQ